MKTIKITNPLILTVRTKTYVFAPYCPDFIAEIKKIKDRKYDATEKCWVIPSTAEQRARDLIAKHFPTLTCEIERSGAPA